MKPSLPLPGQLVRARITRHHEYGVSIELDGGVSGVADIMFVHDDPILRRLDEFPPVGAFVEAVVLQYMPGGQMRLSLRDSDIDLAHVSRGDFLRYAFPR